LATIEDVDLAMVFAPDGGVGNHLSIELRGVLLGRWRRFGFQIPVGGGTGHVEQVVVAEVASRRSDRCDMAAFRPRRRIERVHPIDVRADGVVWLAVSTASAGPAEVAGGESGMTTAALFVGSCTPGGSDGDRDRRGIRRRAKGRLGERSRAQRTAAGAANDQMTALL